MNFDYTYVILFGRQVFEPMVIVTNFFLLLISIYCFTKLIKFRRSYPSQMAWFIIIMGVSGCFGATTHAVHYQLGKTFFDVIAFISNTLNLIAAYFCFRGSYTYYGIGVKPPNKFLPGVVLAWMIVLIIMILFDNKFLLVEIYAGIILIYSLMVHALAGKKNNEKGSRVVVLGIAVSFLSIFVHLLKISLHEWFNHKDLAHVIMIISLIIIYKGIKANADRLYSIPASKVL